MQGHLNDLAAEHGVELRIWDGVPETDARLVLSEPPVIYIKPLRDRRAYFDGLHEFGHVVTGSYWTRSYGLRPVHLVEEVAAWVWAFDNTRVEVSPAIRVRIADLLFVYAQDTGCSTPGDFFGVADVPDDLRAEYVAGLHRLGVLR